MKIFSSIIYIFIFAITFFIFTSSSYAKSDEKSRLAIDPLVTNNMDVTLIDSLTGHIKDYLIRSGRYEIFEGKDVKKSGVTLSLGGSIVRIGDKFIINLRISERGTGRVVKTARESTTEDYLLERMEKVLSEVLGMEDIVLSSERKEERKDIPMGGSGFLYIKSKPSGANVILNGENAGITPRTLEMLKAGRYDIKIVKKGYFSVEREVVLRGGAVVNAEFELKTIYGKLKVDSSPRGASIYVDDVLLGTTPTVISGRLEEGKHNVSIREKGYEVYEEEVILSAGESTGISALLAEKEDHRQYRLSMEKRSLKRFFAWGSLTVSGLFAVQSFMSFSDSDKAYSDADAAYRKYVNSTNVADAEKYRISTRSLKSDGDSRLDAGNSALMNSAVLLAFSLYNFYTMPPETQYEETAFWEPRLGINSMIFTWNRTF